MRDAGSGKPVLPGNHGQFGENDATEEHRPLRATQRVPVRPVVPRGPEAQPGDQDAEAPAEPDQP